MALLTDEQRADLMGDVMRAYPLGLGPVAIDKPQLRAVIDALDTFLNANAGAINSAIPNPQRSLLSVPQKAWLFSRIIERRYVTGA